MQIYEKPVKALMLDFAKECLKSGQVFTKKMAVEWFAKNYPKITQAAVKIAVNGMSVNNAAERKHHPSIKPSSGHDLFYKLGPDAFRLWDKSCDPAPVYPLLQSIPSPVDSEGEETEEPNSNGEFAYERDLQNYLAKNLKLIEPDLTLYEDEGITGIELDADGRRIDILAVDKDGGYLVIELKVSRGYDRVVGQIARYMAWVKENMAEGKPVRGLIVAREITDDLRMSASLIPGIRLMSYQLNFKLADIG